MSDLIVNANAPRVVITIEVDYRYAPEKISFKTSVPMPISVTSKALINCLGTLMDNQISGEARAAGYKPAEEKASGVPPALPQFPDKTN